MFGGLDLVGTRSVKTIQHMSTYMHCMMYSEGKVDLGALGTKSQYHKMETGLQIKYMCKCMYVYTDVCIHSHVPYNDVSF